jgi:flagellar hook-length control protein FliK
MYGVDAPAKKNGAFERFLNAKETKADKEQKAQTATGTDAQTLGSNLAPDNPFPAMPPGTPNGEPSPVAPHAGAITNTQIQNISREIVSEIRSAMNKDGSRTVDIQFDSRTLEGLKVHITEQEGNLSIQFATNSEQVAALLTDHKADLTNALAADGFTVSNISTSVQSKRGGSTATRERGGQRGK